MNLVLTRTLLAGVLALTALAAPGSARPTDDLTERVEHHVAKNGDVGLHYVRIGEGPPLVLIHGFPDYWYTWRKQMEVWAEDFTVIAMDQRGYNKSDKPKGLEHYRMPQLVQDVAAVLRDSGFERATIIGHDWGAAVAWQFAMNMPQMTSRLVILSVPHPSGFGRELGSNSAQQRDSQYARDFQRADSHTALTAAGLAGWVKEPAARALYVEAFERSDFDAMMNYYRANYPKGTAAQGKTSDAAPVASEASIAPTQPVNWPKIQCPVLVLHGVKDSALHAAGHNGTWDWVTADTTIVMYPEAGHFLQHDVSDKVTRAVRAWLWQ